MTRSRKKRKRRALTRHLLPLRTFFFFLKMFVRLRGSETRSGLEALVGRYVACRGETSSRGESVE